MDPSYLIQTVDNISATGKSLGFADPAMGQA